MHIRWIFRQDYWDPVQHATAKPARQLQEPWQIQLIRAEADLRPAVVLRDGLDNRKALTGRESGD